MRGHRDILEEGESLGRPFIVSAAIHGALFGSIFLLTALGVGKDHDKLGDPNAGGFGSVAIEAVATINLPQRNGPRNPVANDSESEIPEKPAPKEVKKAPEPEPDAVSLPSRDSKKDRRAREREQRTVARNNIPERPNNQVYSNVPQAVSSPLYGGASGSGGVTPGVNSVFGTRFGWYAQLIREKVQRSWQTNQIDSRASAAGDAIVAFTIMRDGTVRNVKLVQSSSNYTLDSSAQRAVIEAAPFPKLPDGFERSQADVEFNFRFKR